MKFNLKTVAACCLFGAILLPKLAMAQAVPGSCVYRPGNKTVTVPTVTFPVDAPVGTTVSVSGSASTAGSIGALCNELNSSLVFSLNYYALAQLALVPGYIDVWATKYPGLGVRIPINSVAGAEYLNAARVDAARKTETVATSSVGDNYLVPEGGFHYNINPLPFQFVKTSNELVTGNFPATNLLATYYTSFLWRKNTPLHGATNTIIAEGSNTFFGYYALNSFRVVEPTPTCSLATSSATFNMGALPLSTFTGVGIKQPWVADQSLVSGGCDATTVSMTFAGKAAPAPYNSAFANNGTAQGIALELWQASGAQAIPNGAPITFAAQRSGGSYVFSGRYVQTAATVVGGSVNATITVTLNYQ